MILWLATDKPIHLWKVPNRCVWSSPQLSFVAPVPNSLKRVAAIRLSRYLENSLNLIKENIQYIVFVLFSIPNMFDVVTHFIHSPKVWELPLYDVFQP